MHRFWETIIRPALDAIDAASIVEIGTYTGDHTQKILQYCRERGGVLHAVDSEPRFDVDAWKKQHGDAFVFHHGLSLAVLPILPPADAYLIDGDHNWFTVFHELKQIETSAAGRSFPLIFLHDVGWPYGRRDVYTYPESIPEAFRHTYEQKGFRYGVNALVEGGFDAHGFHAVKEGGPRNGVRTAMEDFVASAAIPLCSFIVPGFHGLGIIASADVVDRSPALTEFFRSLSSPVLLSHLEALEEGYLPCVIEYSILQKEFAAQGGHMGQLQRALHSLWQSKSWRFTAPARRLEQFLRLSVRQAGLQLRREKAQSSATSSTPQSAASPLAEHPAPTNTP